MAWENGLLDLPFEADEDLSNDQYRIVVLDATSGRVRRPNAATDIPLGVLQNAPDAAGSPASVRMIGCGGVTKVELGATLAVSTIVGMEYNSADDAGKAIEAVATQYPVGLLLDGGDEDELASMLLVPLTVKA
jgi:hypothetical protein